MPLNPGMSSLSCRARRVPGSSQALRTVATTPCRSFRAITRRKGVAVGPPLITGRSRTRSAPVPVGGGGGLPLGGCVGLRVLPPLGAAGPPALGAADLPGRHRALAQRLPDRRERRLGVLVARVLGAGRVVGAGEGLLDLGELGRRE